MTQVYKLMGASLVCHAFNGDLSQLALSANSNHVVIFAIPKSPLPNHKYEQLAVLKEHTATVTGLDWAAKSNRIVTCSADRNAYVWTKQADGKWKPTLVVLQINRAAVCVNWSPLENKFAVGSGDRSISVCYFEQEHDWWTAKCIRKPIRSTVTSVDWHPNNSLIACGSTDFKVRIYAAGIKQAGDGKPEETPWGSKLTFGTLLFETTSAVRYQSGGWVHAVSFSADGCRVAWIGHDSSVSVAEAQSAGTPPVVQSLRHPFLPFTDLVWAGRNNLICVGHDCSPMLFQYKGTSIEFVAAMDTGLSEAETGADKVDSKRAAFTSFQAIDRLRLSAADQEAGRGVVKLNSLHQNTINQLKIIRGDKLKAQAISTIGRDGYMIIWDLNTLSQRMANLRIS